MARDLFERMDSSVSWDAISPRDGSWVFGRSTEEGARDVQGVDSGVLRGDRLKGLKKMPEASRSRLVLISSPKLTAVLAKVVGVLSQGENTIPKRVC